LKENRRLLIPLCQRRYCWKDATVWKWFEDVVRGKRDHFGIHNTGNLVVTEVGREMMVIDGQQRTTSTMLFLASTRDALVGMGEGEGKTCKQLERVLFEDGQVKAFEEVAEGEDIASCRLLPSFQDRRSFFQLMLGHQCSEPQSFQARAKAIFDKRIKEETAKMDNKEKLEWLEDKVRASLDRMGVTLVRVLNEVNMAQVFLWLQEKSLFGEAALVYNAAPGVFFTGADMVRNLMLAPIMNQNLEEQEEFYRRHWLLPLERRVGDQTSLNQMLVQFLAATTNESNRFVSAAEETAEKALKSSSITPEGQANIRTYGKFCSLFEEEVAKVDQELGDITEEKRREEASVRVLGKISSFVDRQKLGELVRQEDWR